MPAADASTGRRGRAPGSVRAALVRAVLVRAVPGLPSLVRPVLVAVLVLLGVPAAPAAAEEPLRLEEQLVDRAGAVVTTEGEVQDALEDLREDAGVRLFVVFVEDLDGMGPQEWADRTAVLSGLGRDDVLLAVDVSDRVYAYSVDREFELTDAELAEVALVAVEPALARADWAGAAVGAARGYADVLAGRTPEPVEVAPGTEPAGVQGPGVAPLVVGAVALVALAGAAAILLVLRRPGRERVRGPRWSAGTVRARTRPPAAGARPPDLQGDVDRALVRTDDALGAAERELAVARAEVAARRPSTPGAGVVDAVPGAGDEAGRLRGVENRLRDAKAVLATAFARRERAGREAGADPGRSGALQEVLVLCRTADRSLRACVGELREGRDVPRRASQLLTDLAARLAELRRADDLVGAAERAPAPGAGPLLPSTARECLELVPREVAHRADVAERALERARDHLTASRPGAAALDLRVAEDALGQAQVLLDAGGHLARTAHDAERALPGAERGLADDVAAAERALGATGPPAGDDLRSAVEAARAALATHASRGGAGDGRDPVRSLRTLSDAGGQVDGALAAAVPGLGRGARSRQVAEHSLLLARAGTRLARDVVTTGTGRVGVRARALQVLAEQRLGSAVALLSADPTRAGQLAREADLLARRATEHARTDLVADGPGALDEAATTAPSAPKSAGPPTGAAGDRTPQGRLDAALRDAVRCEGTGPVDG
ncbi:TPM domain-containing protein [Thalassiella azotivora]